MKVLKLHATDGADVVVAADHIVAFETANHRGYEEHAKAVIHTTALRLAVVEDVDAILKMLGE